MIGNERSVVGDAGTGGRRSGIGRVIADGVGGNLVEVNHGLEVLAVAAGVRETQSDAVAQVVLEGQIPLLYGGIFVVDGESVVEVGGSCGTAGSGVEGIGERKQGGHAVGCVFLVVSGEEARMDGPARDQREAERGFNEASPAAAENGLLVPE